MAMHDLLAGALLAVGRTGEITSSLPQAELLARPLQLADPTRAPETMAWPGGRHVLRLSTLLWGLTHALIDRGVSPRTINGRYQLTRPPEPAGLARPSMPKLVAAWTERAMGVGGVAAGNPAGVNLQAERVQNSSFAPKLNRRSETSSFPNSVS